MRDIHWKHSMKLNDFVVKEYSEPQGHQGVLIVNLTAANPEEADIILSTFMSSAVTMARRSLITVVAAYNHEAVLSVTPPLNPRDTVGTVLELAERMVMIGPSQRYLDPQDFRRLRRTIGQLERVGNAPSQKLSELLSLEYAAMQEAAGTHPLSALFSDATRRIPPPATVTVVSLWNHDLEALSVTEEKLKQAGYRVVHALPGGYYPPHHIDETQNRRGQEAELAVG
jgi:hypothetical protein